MSDFSAGHRQGLPGLVPTAARDAVRRMWRRRAVRFTMVALLFLAPLNGWVEGNKFTLGWAMCSAMVGLSMNVLAGYAGQISLAQAVLFGTGAFTVGSLATLQGLPWLVAVPLAGLMTALVALLIGFPALRIRGLNLAIATIGFQFAMQRVIFRAKFFGGAAGVEVALPKIFGIQVDERGFLWVILTVLVLVWILDQNLSRSRAGRAFLALRQDEQVAASFGIPVARYKLLAFAISGFYAGLAGALFGTLQGDVTNELFDYTFSIEFLVFAVLGGLGSRAGTAIGSAFPILFRQFLSFLRIAGNMLGGVLLVVTLLRYQGGMAAQGRELAHVAKLFARRRVVGIAAFLGCIAAAVITGIAFPVVFQIPLRYIGRIVFSRSEDFERALRVIAGLFAGFGALPVYLKIAAQKLKIASGEAPGHTVSIDEEERIVARARALAAPTVSFRRPTTGGTSRGPLLVVDTITKIFGGVRALDGVSMEVREGELIGIMGPNGSGKTTLLNNISGFLTPNSGDIRFKGTSLLKMGPHDRAALGLGRTFQNIGLVKSETVADNFLIAQHLVCAYGPMEGLMRTGAVVSEERRLRQRAGAAIELLGLQDIVGERINSLPHGLAKLVELGCALVTGPELLLLDEPAAGVSPQEADALGETLKNIATNFGVTILMIEHHVPLMLQTCDYIYVLNFGKMLTHGEPMEVAAHPDVIAAYLGSVGKEASLAVAGSH